MEQKVGKKFQVAQRIIQGGGKGDVRGLIAGSNILVLNRGIAAGRAIPTIQSMGAKAIVVANDGDIRRNAMPVRIADEVINIGKHPANYNNLEVMAPEILKNKPDAIWPGWGFLAENPTLPKWCLENGIIFIGPSEDAMSFLGDKVSSKKLADDLGVPTTPFTDVVSFEEAQDWADKNGYPIIVKGKDTGGGRGIRKAFSAKELPFTKGDPSNQYHLMVKAANLFRLNVKEGDEVKAGDELFRTTAMKAEFPYCTSINGRVKKIYRTVLFDDDTESSMVQDGELIMELEPI